MHEPVLLTPGPLTTSAGVRLAMTRDWGSRDPGFIHLTAEVRRGLLEICGASETHACVLIAGSGTTAIEATLGTLVPPSGKVLVLVNGAYGRRIRLLLGRLGRAAVEVAVGETERPDLAACERLLADDPAITHVAAVYCETTTGLRNPIEAIHGLCRTYGKALLIDAMSAFGALPLDARALPFTALMASSNKCLEGAPGVGFAIIEKNALQASEAQAPSWVHDLHDQWRFFERTGQWRTTPPTQVMAGLHRALVELREEGGPSARLRRYQENCARLVQGMTELGLPPLLPAEWQAPIIVTFRTPAHPAFAFERFYESLAAKGFLIYPGKLTALDTFRIGCIGRIFPHTLDAAVQAVRNALLELGLDLPLTTESP